MENSHPIPISSSNSEVTPSETSTPKPFWQAIVEIGEKVPIEEWNKLPKDFARNFEHYMYGAPKEEDYEEE
jgi:hypothetical protein